MNKKFSEIYQNSIKNPEDFWQEVSNDIFWFKKPTKILNKSNPPFYKWFEDGVTNTCYNALDLHIDEGRGEKLALIYDSPITGNKKQFTYKELKEKVSKFAGALRNQGVDKGDRVIIYMPMIPEAVIAMLACGRIGAIHSVVFGGFASNELASRIDDSKAKVIVTASCGFEPGKTVEYKPLVDAAVKMASHKIDKMLADQEIVRVKQDIARYLHGNLQSRVMALGLSLQVRVIKDQVSMDSALSLSQSLLDSPFSEFLAAGDRSLSDEVSFHATKWDGLLNIDVNIEVADSQLSQIQKRAVGTALEEAFSNALRHGLAKEVEIKIYQDGLGITVAVLDDGIGPRNTPLGLGSRLYDSVATRGWSLKHRLDDEGSILELRI